MDKIIQLRKGEDYITLNVLLKISGLIFTGGEAKQFLQQNEVLVNKEIENRRGRKLYPEDKVKVLNNTFLIKSYVDK